MDKVQSWLEQLTQQKDKKEAKCW